MQERHDNDKIKPHNHNKYPLLYKEAELLTSILGRFLECQKWNILVITWSLGIFLIYIPTPSGLQPSGLGIYIRQIPLAHVITITYSFVIPEFLAIYWSTCSHIRYEYINQVWLAYVRAGGTGLADPATAGPKLQKPTTQKTFHCCLYTLIVLYQQQYNLLFV